MLLPIVSISVTSTVSLVIMPRVRRLVLRGAGTMAVAFCRFMSGACMCGFVNHE